MTAVWTVLAVAVCVIALAMFVPITVEMWRETFGKRRRNRG